MKKVSGNGCEYVKCSDWTGTSCAYEGPICKYREDAELLASKDQTIASLRAKLEEAERERDSLKIVGEEISKQCTILNNKLARYREGFEQIKVALKGEGANDGDDVITAVREAIKAVEGLTL